MCGQSGPGDGSLPGHLAEGLALEYLGQLGPVHLLAAALWRRRSVRALSSVRKGLHRIRRRRKERAERSRRKGCAWCWLRCFPGRRALHFILVLVKMCMRRALRRCGRLDIRQTPGRTRTSTSPCGPAAINGFSAILKILMILREFQRGELHASVRKSEDAFPIIIRGASDPAPTLAARTQAKSPAPRCWRT